MIDFDQMYVMPSDTDGNGVDDMFVGWNEDESIILKGFDYDQDGRVDSSTLYCDTDGDGVYDTLIDSYDSSGCGEFDTIVISTDFDGDGSPDSIFTQYFMDTDGDGQLDTTVGELDTDADGIVDVTAEYAIDPFSGEIADLGSLGTLSTPIGGTYYEELDNFDPSESDPSMVSGTPEEAMEHWEYQGNTNRCALYSQKFVIEELTGQEIDIEEFTRVAEDNGWFDDGTVALNMDKMLDYYGVDSDMSFHNSINDIENALNDGHKVIVSLDADEIWHGEDHNMFSPFESANHALEVIGIDHTDPANPMVILNDSGSPDGCGEMVPLDVFTDAWEDGNCQMIECWN